VRVIEVKTADEIAHCGTAASGGKRLMANLPGSRRNWSVRSGTDPNYCTEPRLDNRSRPAQIRAMTVLMLGRNLELALYRAEVLGNAGHTVTFPKTNTITSHGWCIEAKRTRRIS
jgi:hypothetical protein